MILQLYLHFPFCKRKCFYCDFVSGPENAETVAAYCLALQKEIRLAGEKYAGAKVSSVFLGGGTPSVVPFREMAEVLGTLRACFDLLPGAEFTAEANPGTLEADWLQTAMRYGLNRLSLGVQAAQDGLLRGIGRIHTFAQAKSAVRLARSCGINNLNLDLMFGLPGQTLEAYRESMEATVALAPEHVSAYSLILEEGTPLESMVEQGRALLPDEEETAEMYEQGARWLAGAGYERYEISNFARPGHACRHNLGYWQGAWYLGLGAAAHSMLPPDADEAAGGAARVRRANTSDLRRYIAAMQTDGEAVAQRTPISAQEAMFETMMLGLRMTEGVSERAFLERHGMALTARYGGPLERLVREGLGQWLGATPGHRRFALTARGLEMQNAALLRLME